MSNEIAQDLIDDLWEKINESQYECKPLNLKVWVESDGVDLIYTLTAITDPELVLITSKEWTDIDYYIAQDTLNW